MSRDNFSHLPQSQELAQIMNKEAFRPLPAGKEHAHFVEFGAIKALLEVYGLSSDFFTKSVTPQDVVSSGLLEEGEACIRELTERIALADPNQDQEAALNSVYAYLAEEDSLASADAIFVFGAKTLLRVEKAFELYKHGLAPRLLLSGGQPSYLEGSQQSEADRYAQHALDAGVPESAITREAESITVADNVRRSLNLLDSQGKRFKRIILVNSPYVQRRGWVFFMKYIDEGVSLVRVNCETAEKYRAGEWWRNEEGRTVVLNEWVKLKVAVSLNTA